MASVHKDRGGYRIQWLDGDRKRRRIRITGFTKRDAESIASKVQSLVSSRIAGTEIGSALAGWVRDLGSDLRTKLESANVIDPVPPSKSEQDTERQGPEPSFDSFIASYIENRKDAADNTVRNWTNSQGKLSDYFGKERLLRDISPGDADDWRQSMVNSGLAKATISKAVKHAKQFANLAVRKGLAGSSPFQDLVAGGEKNKERQEFIDRERIDRVISFAPNDEWKLIIALSRYGGLRCPSETLSLRWEHIDWERNRFTVYENKTSTRVVPIFPELRPYLENLFFNEDRDESGFVITRYRGNNSNLRTQFLRIIARAGIPSWERLFHNLRASRETELSASFPMHVVCAWIGNSEQTAKDHYLKVTESDFESASRWGREWGQCLQETNGIEGNLRPHPAPMPLVFSENALNQGVEIPPRGNATTLENKVQNADASSVGARVGAVSRELAKVVDQIRAAFTPDEIAQLIELLQGGAE